jgi:hypothetical protein
LDKKTACCGCSCLVIVLIIIGVVVGGYYGFSFLHSAGKEMAAITLEKTMESVTEKAFAPKNRKIILAEVNKVANDLKDSKIGLIDFIQEGTQQLESGMYSKVMLLSFKHHYIVNAETGAESELRQNGAQAVDRLLYGLSENKIRASEIASVTMKITEHFQEKLPKKEEGGSSASFSNRRINENLTKEDVQKCLIIINEVCERNNVVLPDSGYAAETAVKEEILQILTRLQQKGEKGP